MKKGLEIGRHYKINMVIDNHLLSNGKDTRRVLNEISSLFTAFAVVVTIAIATITVTIIRLIFMMFISSPTSYNIMLVTISWGDWLGRMPSSKPLCSWADKVPSTARA